jgi:hypothetical protein
MHLTNERLSNHHELYPSAYMKISLLYTPQRQFAQVGRPAHATGSPIPDILHHCQLFAKKPGLVNDILSLTRDIICTRTRFLMQVQDVRYPTIFKSGQAFIHFYLLLSLSVLNSSWADKCLSFQRKSRKIERGISTIAQPIPNDQYG